MRGDNEPMVEVELRGSVGPRGGPLYGPGRALVPLSLARSLGMAGFAATVEVPQSQPPAGDGGAQTPLAQLFERDLLELSIRELRAALETILDPDALVALAEREAGGKDRRGALEAIEARRAALEDGS